jgi:hypothetical protein
MAQTDGQQPILYNEGGSMSVLPKGAESARHVSAASGEYKSKLDLESQGASGEKTGSLGFEREVAGTGDADFEDAGDVMAALEKQEKAPFPEGGRQAWLTVLGTFCCTMVTFGVLNTYGVSLPSSSHSHAMIDTNTRSTKRTSRRRTCPTTRISPSIGSARCNTSVSLVLVFQQVCPFQLRNHSIVAHPFDH